MPIHNTRARLHRALAADDAARQSAPITVPSIAGSATVTRRKFSPVMPNGPLRLTDDQLAAVMRAAEPLAVGDRGAFLLDVAAALQGQELGDGTVYRVIAQVQRRYFDAPIMSSPRRWER
jgi:hypothetical protein